MVCRDVSTRWVLVPDFILIWPNRIARTFYLNWLLFTGMYFGCVMRSGDELTTILISTGKETQVLDTHR